MRASKSLGTRRRKSGEKKTTIIERVLAHIQAHGETGYEELGRIVGCAAASSACAIRKYQATGSTPRIRVCGWDDVNGIHYAPRFDLGNKPDELRPLRPKSPRRVSRSHARRPQKVIDQTDARASQMRDIDATIARIAAHTSLQPGNVFAPLMVQLECTE